MQSPAVCPPPEGAFGVVGSDSSLFDRQMISPNSLMHSSLGDQRVSASLPVFTQSSAPYLQSQSSCDGGVSYNCSAVGGITVAGQEGGRFSSESSIYQNTSKSLH